MTSQDNRPVSRSRLLHWPVLAIFVAIAAIFAMTFGLLLDARLQVEVRTRETSWNLLGAIQRDIVRNIEVLDLSLQATVDGLSRPDVMALPAVLRHQVLFDRSTTATGIGALLVFDAEGELRIDSTSINLEPIKPVTDRDYFQAQQAEDRGLFIGRPYVSRVIKQEVMGLSRRRSGPDGAFAGVVLGTIKLSYFKELFGRLRLEPGTTIGLVRTDGAAILRLEPDGFKVGGDLSASPVFQAMQNAGSGDYVGRSLVDDVERLYSFERLGDRPLILAMGVPTASIYGDWWVKSALVLGALTLIALIMVALSVLLSRELRRRQHAETRLIAANAELERLSMTDALTGLGNRRCFDEVFSNEARRAVRNRKPLCLILLDVDQFKLFNDRYGHPQGDVALKTVAAVLRENTRRPGDGAFRIGGEEFAVVLVDTPEDGAVAVMEAIRSDLKTFAVPHAASKVGHLSVSQGATGVTNGDTARAMERADAALYRAKRDGRDRAYMRKLLSVAS